MSDTDESMKDYMTQIRDQEARERERVKGVWGKLEEAKVGRVVVEYNGQGDSGEIEGVTFHDAEGQQIGLYSAWAADKVEPWHELGELVEAYVYAHLPSGWEINEGSYGDVTFLVASRTAHFNHKDRVETYEAHPFEVSG